MTVSAVLTTFNRREFLREALASVRRQTSPPDQIIILDDGSTDGTRGEMEKLPGLDYHWQENAGTSAARNAGWRLARGEWIAYLDSDDLWTEDKLARQFQAARENPEAEAIFGHALNFTGEEIRHFFDPEKHRLGVPLPAPLPSAALVRRSLLERMGGFDPALKIGEVTAWHMRLRELRVPTVMLPGVVLRRRLHLGNKQQDTVASRRENFALIHRWNQQRRAREARP